MYSTRTIFSHVLDTRVHLAIIFSAYCNARDTEFLFFAASLHVAYCFFAFISRCKTKLEEEVERITSNKLSK